MKVLIFLIFHPHLSMELAIMDLKEVEILTFGQFGLEEQNSKHTFKMLEDLTVSLELKPYLFGKPLSKQSMTNLHTNHPPCFYMKDIIADLAL